MQAIYLWLVIRGHRSIVLISYYQEYDGGKASSGDDKVRDI